MVTILNQIYEEDFLGFSYGFCPGRSQHQALNALYYALVKREVNYVLDADIQGFFDNLDKAWMIKFVEHCVANRRILRLIQKWLKAGEMEEGKWLHTQTGTPQGSVISPLLANIYFHDVFDLWVDVGRKRYARGEGIVLRLCSAPKLRCRSIFPPQYRRRRRARNRVAAHLRMEVGLARIQLLLFPPCPRPNAGSSVLLD